MAHAMKMHRHSAAGTFCAVGLFVVGLLALYEAAAQSPSATSPRPPAASPDWALSVTAPPVIEAATNLDIFVKCKLTNIGDGRLASFQRARLYLIDSVSQTQKLLYYTAGDYEGPRLDPGESTIWWQHGRATAEGSFKLFARWEAIRTIESSAVPVTIRRSAAPPEDIKSYRTAILRQNADRFLEIVPNTSTTSVAYSSFSFTNDAIRIDSALYNAFSFVVPDGGGELEWSYITDPFNHISWGIIPAEGNMDGFQEFYYEGIGRHVPGIAGPGERVIVQTLPSEQLIPHHRYYIWFQCPYRDPPTMMLSLNIFPDGPHPRADVFKGIYDGP